MEHFAYQIGSRLWICQDLMLPKPDDRPPVVLQLQGLSTVAVHILKKFTGPECLAGSGSDVMDWTAMPKTAIHKDRDLGPHKDKVRLGPPDAALDSVTYTPGPEGMSENSLWGCMCSPDAGHDR